MSSAHGADDMWTTFGCMPVDDTCMTLGVVLHEIGQLRQVRMMCGRHADDIWMSSAHGVDDIQTT